MQAKKSLGQHFLMHPQIAERIVSVADLSPRDTVFEIGPGTGMLTRVLLQRVARVIALEADAGLFSQMREEFTDAITEGKLLLMQGDIRTYDPTTLPRGYKVVANIPYYLTGDILRKFLSSANQPSSMTLLVQKEVAERIARSKKESLPSLSVKVYGTPRFEFKVSRGAFKPAPKIDSAVLTIKDISRAHFKNEAHEKRFFRILKTGFGQKRKQLAKNLKKAGFGVEQIKPRIRAEDLPLADWLLLAQ